MKIIKAPIASVLPWDKNPRGIKTKDYERLKKQILKLGVYKPLLAYEEKGKYVVLGGNMRIRALKDMGLKEVDISVVKPKTEAEKVEFALSDNDRAGFYEEDKLAELVYPHIKDIELGDFKVDLGEALDLKQVVERYGPDIEDGADDVPEVDDSPAITGPGDLFTLGKHRLLCGDSTKAEDVARLMRGEKADLGLADPPYNVGLQYGENVNDRKDEAQFRDFSFAWFDILRGISARQIVTPGGQNLFLWAHWFQAFHVGCWTKPFCKTNGKIAHLWSWEPIFFYGEKWSRERANDIFEFAVTYDAKLADSHPCPKPLALWCDILAHYSEKDSIILDPFLGSGTTLIAAEKTGRICYGMEIDPKYCDVIIKRYADYAGVSEDGIRKTREKANG